MAPTYDSNAVWLVTGCSSGMGKCYATHIYNAGHNIVATARNVETLNYLPDGPKVLKLALDVCSQESITAAFDTLLKRFGRLDVVINNAGYGSMCEAESFPEDAARNQFDTNFWGPVRITKESIRIFRDVNAPGEGGTIVQVSSVGGLVSYPGNSIYAASKHALEGYTKAVKKELNPKWNISVMIVAPGGIATNFHKTLLRPQRDPVYADDPETPYNKLLAFFRSAGANASAWEAVPEKCAAAVFDLIQGQKERPLPTRLSLGSKIVDIVKGEIDQLAKDLKDYEDITVGVMKDSA